VKPVITEHQRSPPCISLSRFLLLFSLALENFYGLLHANIGIPIVGDLQPGKTAILNLDRKSIFCAYPAVYQAHYL